MKLAYYIATGLRDASRARRSLLANVFIVAGICLPIILLIGLQRGLVEQFRQNILKNATARQIRVYVTAGERIGRTREAELQRKIPGVSLVIPYIPKQAALSNAGGAKVELTVHCTKPNDPYLDFYGAAMRGDGRRGIVITRSVSDALKIGYTRARRGRLVMTGPAKVILRVTRPGDEDEGDVAPQALPTPGAASEAPARPSPGQTVDLDVKAVLDPGTDDKVAYVDRQMAEWMQIYTQGLTVAELKWPGSRRPAKVFFEGFLSFIKSPYSESDKLALRSHGLAAVELTDADERGRLWRTLCGLLRPHNLHVY